MNYIPRLLSGIKEELLAILRVSTHLGPRFWVPLLPLLAGCFVGLVGGLLGAILQGGMLVVLASIGLFSGYLARRLRQRQWVHFAHGEEVAPVLPQFLTLLMAPLFFLAMFVEFKVVADAFPELLPVQGKTGVLLLVLDNLSKSQLFFGFFQAFELHLVPTILHPTGVSIVLLTRGLMDLVFIKFLVQVFHAAWFRSQGLGRGQDLLYQVHQALREHDAGLVQLRARAIRASLLTAIESLVQAVERGARHAEEAWRALVSMRLFALPVIDNGAEALTGEARTHSASNSPNGSAPPPPRPLTR